ncbi:MAG: DUF2905 domain-containing protein [Thermodesulfobacteriota bacterium]
MNPWSGLAKLLILFGLILSLWGGLLVLLQKIPWLGRMPGDLFFKGEKFSIYFPLTSCIIISIVLTLLFALFKR